MKDEIRKKNTEISNLENKIDVLEDKHQKYKDNISNIFENNLASEILKPDGLNLSFLEDSVELAHIDKVTNYIHLKLQEIV